VKAAKNAIRDTTAEAQSALQRANEELTEVRRREPGMICGPASAGGEFGARGVGGVGSLSQVPSASYSPWVMSR